MFDDQKEAIEKMSKILDIEKAEYLFETLFELFSIKKTEHTKNTPKRMVKMYAELFSSILNPEPPKLTTFNSNGYDQLITSQQIPFYSLCAHHLLPFFGTVSISYLPGEKMVGISKLARIVDYFSHKPQIQEQMTQEIVDYIYRCLEPKGCGVLVEARHLCMEMRGVRNTNELITTALRGKFLEDTIKQEFLRTIDI